MLTTEYLELLKSSIQLNGFVWVYFEVQNKVQFFGKRMEGLAFRCMFFHKSLGGSNFARIKKKQIFGLEFLDKCFVDSRANVF